MANEDPQRLSLADSIVLALIDEEPRHGFSIARELKENGQIGNIWSIPVPLVYRAIDHLNRGGFIEAIGTEPGTRGPTRTVYRSTALGSARTLRWLTEPVDHPRDVRAELIAKLALSCRRGQGGSEVVRRQLERFKPIALGLADKAACAAGPDRFVALWRVEHMSAIIRLLENLLDETAGQGAT